VTFREDGDVIQDKYAPSMAELPGSLYGTVVKSSPEDLKHFLRRPVILSQGAWNVGDPTTTNLGSWSFPDALMASIYTKQIKDKLTGYTLMKGKIRLRLQVNSQPSYAGMLLLSYIPHADYMLSKTLSLYSTLTSLTGCTHSIMNLASSTSIEFVTPYISPHLYVNLATGQGTFGRANLQVMSPLTIGGSVSTPVTWTLWASFDDIELCYPTNAVPVIAYAQVGGEVTRMKNTGVISGGIGTVGRVVSGILPALGLGALTEPVEALASSAAGIARFFGFSKPSSQEMNHMITNRPGRGHLNMDGADCGHKLGASVATELQTLSGFAGTDEDEMNLGYIVSRPAAIDSVAWLSTAIQDTLVASYVVTPNALIWNAANITPAVARTTNLEIRMTPAAFVADKYNMWRGDIVYTFHFVKTQLHSGRLRFNFKPYVGTLFPGSSIDLNAAPGFTMTEDVDLSSCSEFRFKVPFVCSRPWLLTQWPITNAPTSSVVDIKNCAVGELEIVVLNQLTAMSTANPNVQIVVLAHMENAAFAVPRRSQTLPNLNTTAVASKLMDAIVKEKRDVGRRPSYFSSERVVRTIRANEAVAQVGGEPAKTMSDTQSPAGIPLIPAAMCQGEVHTSFRQALKRYNLVSVVKPSNQTPTGDVLVTDGRWFVLRPWEPADNSNLVLGSTVANNWCTVFNDLYSACFGLYAFYRGSMRFRIVFDEPLSETFPRAFSVYLAYPSPIQPSLDVTWPRAEEHPYTSSNMQVTTGAAALPCNPVISSMLNLASFTTGKMPYNRDKNGWEALSFTILEGAVEFEVPYYSVGHMSTTNYHTFNGDFWADQRNGVIPLPVVMFGSTSMPYTRFRVYRAVGDDFSFAGMQGVPRSTVPLELYPRQVGYDPSGANAALTLGPRQSL